MTRLLLWIALLISTTSLIGQTGTVVFQVYDIRPSAGGEISAGVFTQENFPKVGQHLKRQVQAVEAAYMELTITDVPVGTYGAVAFHDLDRNKDLNTNFVGFPTEPIGFANGAKIRLGPPDFADAAIQVKANQITTVDIRLK